MLRNICLVAAVIAAACTHSGDEPPRDILSLEQITALMVDLQLAEAMRTYRSPGLRMPDASYTSLYDGIFEKHGVDREVFLRSHAWYIEHPELLERIYESVIDTLTRRELELKQRYNQQLIDERAYAADTLRRKTAASTLGRFPGQ
jgi:hypothetical protein